VKVWVVSDEWGYGSERQTIIVGVGETLPAAIRMIEDDAAQQFDLKWLDPSWVLDDIGGWFRQYELDEALGTSHANELTMEAE
jgi:hypothetical protein